MISTSYGLNIFRKSLQFQVIPRTTNLQIFHGYNNNNNHSPLQTYKNSITSVRRIQTNNVNRRPKTPDLIYVPQVLRWLKNKFRMKYLQKTWDPDFSEGAFIYGTTRAVCRITEIINEGKPELLEGLLTPSAKIKLQEDITTRLTKTQKKIIKLRPEDIKILVPITVNLKHDGFIKQCDVALRSLALKWHQDKGTLKLVLVALQTEFMRDYSHGTDSEWIISVFEILECAMLSQQSPTAPK